MKIVDVLKQSVFCAKRMSIWVLVLFGLFAPFSLYSSVLYVESENSAGAGSLREAIARAGDGDVIQFKVKIVRLSLPIEIPDRFENYGLKIDGGSGKTIIDGGGTSRIFTIRGTGDGKVELSNLIIQNGNDNAVSFDLDIDDSFGPTPGVHPEFRSTVKNCIFENNKGTSGGAIEFRNPNYGSAYLTVESCEFTGNSSSDVGGAIYTYIHAGGGIRVTNCEFENNKATNSGGAVYDAGSPTIIRGCRFVANRANRSGGLYNVRTVIDSTFENNEAATIGACSAQNVCGCTFVGNTASEKTSALELPAGGVLLNSTFVENSGGQYVIYAQYERGTHWYVCNNVIIGNSPAVLGHGGAYSRGSDAGGASMEFCYNTHDCTWESDGYRVGEAKEGDIDSSSADAVFANVRGGIAEGVPVYKDGVRHLRFVVKQNGSADKNGVYVWHDADWANIAYSQTLSGAKTALVGSVDKATTRVQEDACGEQIGNPPNRGACAISASGSSSPTSLPDAPTGVSATDGSYADYARVTWSAASGATSYNLYRSTTSSRPSTATKTGVTSPYNDTTATPGTKYYYWIAAVNSAGSSVSSYDTGYRAVSLTLGKSSDSYLASGGSGSSSVTANTSWSASANVSWISFGTSTGNGNGTVTYTVSANTSSASSRTGTITVTAGSGASYPVAKTIAVSQEAPARTTYTVVFNANGGSGTMENQTIHYCTFKQIGSGGIIFIDNTGENTPLSANAFTKSGYVFSGWSTSPNGAVLYTDEAKVTNLAEAGGTITLYAVWAAESDFEIVGGVLTKYKGPGGAVTIPSGVTSIGDSAFAWCETLTSVTIPQGVTSIGNYAFYVCDSLTSVTIPSGVSSIGRLAFAYCDTLSVVTIPSSVTSIGENAFIDCKKLTAINVASGNVSYCSDDGILYDRAKSVLVQCPGGKKDVVTIPSSVTNIRNSAFSGCSSLTSVLIPSGVTSIGDWAFASCKSLLSLTIPSCVTSIGDYAFYDCSSLTSVAIPSSVRSIGSSGFAGCYWLRTIYVSLGDAVRVRNLMSASGFDVGGVEFVEPATTYTVSFNANGGTGTMTSQTITYGVSTSLKVNAFTKNGYTFAGWSKTAGGSVAYANGASVSNLAPAGGSITLYAVWTPQVVAPSAPTGVSATDGSYADYVRVTWSAASGATSYNLYRSTTTTRPSTATKTGVTSPYNDTTATPGTKYYYWIAAINSAGTSVSSYDTGYRAVSLTLGKSTDTYASTGGNGSVSVTANTLWSATTGSSWITLGTKSGSGNGTLTYTVAANTSTSSRTGTITVTAGSGTSYPVSKTITVSQGAVDFVIADGVLTKYTGAGGSVTIPSGVKSIGYRAFYDCRGLTSVTIPSGVTSIEGEAFYKCSGLTSVSIPSSLTSIGVGAFDSCSGLTSVTIPSGVTSIRYAFYECSGLTSVTISSGVTDISEYAFYGCSSLTSVTIPSSVTSIGQGAFLECERLTSVTIPEGVTSIGDGAFGLCSGLTAINVNGGNNDYCSIDGVLYIKQKTKLIQCPGGKTGAVTIPSSVTSIGSSAFSGCSYLTSINVDSANRYYCSIEGVLYNKSATELICCPGGAKAVTIPSSVTSIGRYAFYGCGLTSVTLLSSVKSIGYYAFYNCSGLKTVCVSLGDTERVRNLMSASGFSVAGVEFVELVTTYTVLFNANGGAGTMTSQTITNGVTTVLTANSFTYSGYVFAGWATTADEPVVYADNASVLNLTLPESSITLYAVWEKIVIPTPSVSPADGTMFSTDSRLVTLDCAMEGASIYYTTNGTTPKTSAAYLYTQPFEIHGTVNVKAVAVKDGVKSDYATVTITKVVLTLESALGVGPDVRVTTGGEADWVPVNDANAKEGGTSARSGLEEGDDDSESWLQLRVIGKGELSFWCKTSCEHDVDNTCSWDRLEVYVDGALKADWCMDGVSQWIRRTVTFDTDGEHVVKILYVKDESESDGQDCAWVDNVVWTPSEVPTVYVVEFNANGGTGTMTSEAVGDGRVFKLPKCAITPPAGKRFAGWACSNGRRYDDGMLVFNLAEPGETVTMTAIWE